MNLGEIVTLLLFLAGSYALIKPWLKRHGLIIPPISTNIASWIVNRWNSILPSPTDDYVTQRYAIASSDPRPDTTNEVPSMALANPAAVFADERKAFHKIDIIKMLAGIKMIDTDGIERLLSADKIAALVNMRAESVREVVRGVRGVTPEPQEPYDPKKHLMVDGASRFIERA